MRRLTIHRMTAGAILAACGTPLSAQTSTYIGPPTGLWSNPGFWNPNSVPDSAVVDVVVNGTSVSSSVTLDSDRRVRSLSIGWNDAMRFADGSDLTVFGSSIVNDNLVEQTGATLETLLLIASPTLTMSGNGTWALEGGAASAIEATSPGNALINETDHVISGTGLVGNLTSLGVINHGVIRSEGDAPGSLDLEPGLNADAFLTFDIVNTPTGVIETFGDARKLTIRNADIRNEGEIRSRSGNGSQVSLDGVYIDNNGGLVSDVVIRGGAWLSGGRAAGNSRVQGLGGVIEDLELRGVLVSQVPVRMRGEISTTLLSAKLDIVGGALVDPETGATFSGTTGGFHIRGAVANTNPTLPALLTISEGALVRGDGGQIGQGDRLGVINHGRIRVEDIDVSNDPFEINPGRDANVQGEFDLVNTETGEISLGGDGMTLIIRNADVLNEGAIFKASGQGASVKFSDATVHNTNGMVSDIDLRDGSWLIGGEARGFCRTMGFGQTPSGLDGVSITTNFSCQVPVHLRNNVSFRGTVGVLRMADGGLIDPGHDLTISGSGLVELVDEMRNSNPATSSKMRIAEGTRVACEDASLGVNDRFGLVNDGDLYTDDISVAEGPLVIDPGVHANAAVTVDFQNNGSMRAREGINILLRNGLMENTGLIEAEPNTSVIFESTAEVVNQNGDTLEGGTWRVNGPTLQPSLIQMGGDPIRVISNDASVELLGPIGRLNAGGVDLNKSLEFNLGTLRLLDGHNFLSENDIENRGMLELGVGADYLGLDFADGLTLHEIGTLKIILSTADEEGHGQIDMSGPVHLGGALEITLDGDEPTLGDTFQIIHADMGVFGQFDAVSFPSLGSGLSWELTQTPMGVTLRVVGGACPADLAEPFGSLDFTDVLAFLTAFGAEDPLADMAEPFGSFDFTDVLAFLSSFGAGCP